MSIISAETPIITSPGAQALSQPKASAVICPIEPTATPYQPICVPPSSTETSFDPAVPNVYLDMTTVVSPVRAPRKPIAATYAPSTTEPTSSTARNSEKRKAAPMDAPAISVGAKTVKPISTTEIETTPRRAEAGTGVTG